MVIFRQREEGKNERNRFKQPGESAEHASLRTRCVRIASLATSAVRYNIFMKVAATTKISFINRLKEAFKLYRLSCHTCRSDKKLINYEFLNYYEVMKYYHVLFGL